MASLTDSARPRGILNERERQYLLGDTDIEPRTQTERDIRATIRERLRHAIFDYALLFDQLENRDIEQVFDSRADDAAELRTAIEDTLGFFYRATINFHPPFQHLATEGIQRAEQAHFDRYVKATIDIEATAPIDPDVIKAKMTGEQDDRLTPEEASWIAETVLASDAVSFSDLDEAHDRLRHRQAGLHQEKTYDPTADND
ncbi:hypothetical protein [Halorarum salinum]|uniref:Domain of unknown function domain-containing protein n=1 Tax=Halorarum salinum TaxID=2743089 RepID=A0A7D5QG38_9EURY|nr:hypothetical protein [Halobaculum salinum]QLG61923.1 hypothetical protein HUG12_09395 [Halobaculum salinum]